MNTVTWRRCSLAQSSRLRTAYIVRSNHIGTLQWHACKRCRSFIMSIQESMAPRAAAWDRKWSPVGERSICRSISRQCNQKKKAERRLGYGSIVGRLTFVTLEIEDPAASRMFLRPSQQTVVLSAMLPSTRLPSAAAGIWPETKMRPPALTACD